MSLVFRQCKACKVSNWIPEGRAQEGHECRECGATSWADRPQEFRKHGGVIIPDSTWSRQNGGRGYYCSQLETGPSSRKSKDCYVQSARELKEKCAQRGLSITRDGY